MNTHIQTHARRHAHTKISVTMETRQIPWRAIRPTLNLVAMTTLRNRVSCGMTLTFYCFIIGIVARYVHIQGATELIV